MPYVYTQDNGLLACCSTNFDGNCRFVESLPDSVFDNRSWKEANGRVEVDPASAKEQVHESRRRWREIQFTPHDEIISKQIPGKSAVAAEGARQIIRDDDAAMQLQIDACETTEDLRSLLTLIGE